MLCTAYLTSMAVIGGAKTTSQISAVLKSKFFPTLKVGAAVLFYIIIDMNFIEAYLGDLTRRCPHGSKIPPPRGKYDS